MLFGGSIEITDSCCHGQLHTQKTIIKDDYLSKNRDTIFDFKSRYPSKIFIQYIWVDISMLVKQFVHK